MQLGSEYIERGVQIQEVDARELDTQLVRTAALMDRHQPFVVLLTHYDDLLQTDHRLDYVLLGKLFGVRIGLVEDKATILAEEDAFRHVHVAYGKDVEEAIAHIVNMIVTLPNVRELYSKRYMAIRLLERPDEMLALLPHSEELIRVADHEREVLQHEYGLSAKEVIAQARSGFVHGALEETLTHAKNDTGHSLADKIDKVLTNKWLGLPVLMMVLYVVFECTFTLGAYPQEWIDAGVGWLYDTVRGMMAEGPLRDMLTDGVISGVGSVLVFLPNIMILYLFISFFEDSGYLARAAFIMDKVMHRMGVHGKSFIPMVMGFGCNVPAVMATRTIECRTSRIITIMVVPFMSCSARLPVFVLLISAFFADNQGLVLLSVYAVGVLVAILTAVLFRRLFFKEDEVPFVMELPPYRMPTMRNTLRHMWDKSVQYLSKMGTVILTASILIWALGYFPQDVDYSKDYEAELQKVENNSSLTDEQREELTARIKVEQESEHTEKSYIGQLGHAIEPVIEPLGYDWKIGVSIITGLAAKEIVVGSMGVLYQSDLEADENSANLQEKLKTQKFTSGDKVGQLVFTPVVAYSFMIFVLLYFPCFAALAAIRREAGTKWAALSAVYTTGVAWIVAFVVTQVGSLL